MNRPETIAAARFGWEFPQWRRLWSGALFLSACAIASAHDVPESGDAAASKDWWKNNGHPRGAWWKDSAVYKGAEAEEIWERIERPPVPVLSPEEALETFLLPEGFRLELVAAEPLVTRPVFLRFDPAGRLWTVEMNGFMRDVDATGEEDPSGRVVVLEDTDGDGRMDKSTVFMEGLVMPRTLAFVDGGVLVVEPPRIWFAQDTDGDLKADKRSLVAEDYGNDDSPEHSANGLMPALDNWMYSAKSDMRYRFVDGKLRGDATLFRGQWGMTQDDSGRLFYNYNSSPLHAELVPGQYFVDENGPPRPPRSNGVTPLLVNRSLVDDLTVKSAHVTPQVTLGASDLNEDGTLKRYSAACAPLIYRGDLFPAAYRGNAFVCDPVGNLIGRFVIRGAADTLQAQTAREADREFLISTDERFRPVHLETGPEGALYIADMYTGIIEHRMFVTEYLRNQTIERGLNGFTPTGRIYRLVPEDRPAPAPVLLNGASPAELVERLAHPNGWVRDTAQRLLVEQGHRSVVPELRRRVANQGYPLGRLHALWSIDGLRRIDEATVMTALADPDLRVRAAALRIGESVLAAAKPGGEFIRAFRALADDASVEVRLQLILSLGQVDAPWGVADIAALLRGEAAAAMDSAAVAALDGRELAFLKHVVGADDWSKPVDSHAEVIKLLAAAVQKRNEPTERAALATLSGKPDDWRLMAIGLGVQSAMPERSAIAVEALSAEAQRLFKIGESRYAQICIACHQADGQGLANVAPALAGSRRANASPDAAIRIVLHGFQGELSMAGFGSIPGLMDDEAVAATLTYVRRSWGNTAEPITPEQVAVVRSETEGRSQPWTAKELEVWIQSK